MKPSKINSELRKKVLSLSLGIIVSIILAIIIPLLLVAYDDLVWGGEGLFSFIIVFPIFGAVLALLGIGISVSAYILDNNTKRDKVIKFGGIIYIGFIFMVFAIMSVGPFTNR